MIHIANCRKGNIHTSTKFSDAVIIDLTKINPLDLYETNMLFYTGCTSITPNNHKFLSFLYSIGHKYTKVFESLVNIPISKEKLLKHIKKFIIIRNVFIAYLRKMISVLIIYEFTKVINRRIKLVYDIIILDNEIKKTSPPILFLQQTKNKTMEKHNDKKNNNWFDYNWINFWL